MTDQLSATDWLNQGLKTLAKNGFTALKAEPLAKAMGVSRGSFYWHFADIRAFHAAILNHWREVAAEQIIADVEAAAKAKIRWRCCCAGYLARSWRWRRRSAAWAAVDPAARAAVQAIDRRRLSYVESLLHTSGLSAASGPRPRANSVLGFLRLCAFGPAFAEGKTTGRGRRIDADGLEVAAPVTAP